MQLKTVSDPGVILERRYETVTCYELTWIDFKRERKTTASVGARNAALCPLNYSPFSVDSGVTFVNSRSLPEEAPFRRKIVKKQNAQKRNRRSSNAHDVSSRKELNMQLATCIKKVIGAALIVNGVMLILIFGVFSSLLPDKLTLINPAKDTPPIVVFSPPVQKKVKIDFYNADHYDIWSSFISDSTAANVSTEL